MRRVCLGVLMLFAAGPAHSVEPKSYSVVDLSLDADLLSMEQQDGKAWTTAGTIWLIPLVGLSGEGSQAETCAPGLEPHGLRNGERRYLGGLAFRAGQGSIQIERITVLGGVTTFLGQTSLTANIAAVLRIGLLRSEVVAYSTQRTSQDFWYRMRSDLTLYRSGLYTFALGGQYTGRSFIDAKSAELDGYKPDTRFFNSSGGVYGALGTRWENCDFRFTAGGGKGSAPEFDYVGLNARLTWHF